MGWPSSIGPLAHRSKFLWYHIHSGYDIIVSMMSYSEYMWYHNFYDIIDCDLIQDIICAHIILICDIASQIFYHIWWVHKPMQPAPGPAFWPEFIPLQHNHYCTAHYSHQAAFYDLISGFLLWSASKYGAMQQGHGTVPVRRSLQCKFGLKRFTNWLPTHCRHLHPRRVSLGCFHGVVGG